MGAVEPYIMMGLQPTGPTRVNLEVIVPSPKGLTPAMWKQTATLCPLEWPSNCSLQSFHRYVAQLKQQMQHRHMFTHWEVNRAKLASRVLFQRPAHYLPETILRQHVQERVFPQETTRKVSFQTKSPLRLGTAGMTLSEQTSNTTLNHTESDERFSFPFSSSRFFGSCAFIALLSSFKCHFLFCSHWLRLCGGSFALVGLYLMAPPLFCMVFSCAVRSFMFSLPSSGFRPTGLSVFLSDARRPCGVVGGGSIPRWSAGKPQSGDQPKGTWHRPQKKIGVPV